jgi:hypothetical protein
MEDVWKLSVRVLKIPTLGAGIRGGSERVQGGKKRDDKLRLGHLLSAIPRAKRILVLA